MSLRTDETACPFNAQEREYIRRELDLFFGTLPSVADGFQLRTWRSGPLAGQPKLPPALRTMVDSGLMEIRTGTPLPTAYFTERGLGSLRRLASDRRYMDQHKFAHVRRELGLPNPQARRHARSPVQVTPGADGRACGFRDGDYAIEAKLTPGYHSRTL